MDKIMKVKLPEQSPVWRDLVAYAEEQGVPPAEAARSILTQWSRALRGMNAFGGMIIPQQHQVPVQSTAPAPPVNQKREQDKARGARFAGALTGLDDDE